MIFDIPEIENLRSKHAGKAPHLLPGILQIDQLKEYEAEREILEQMFEFVPINKRQHLLQELLSDQIGKHLGAWFQLMLCELLVDAGQGDVKVEVNLLDNNPDFLIEMQSQSLVIEATSSLGNLVRNPRRDTENTIFGIFHGIQHPYVITGSISNVGSSISEIQLTAQLIEWIENHPNEGFSYKDQYGNRIVLNAYKSSTPKIIVSLPAQAIRHQMLLTPLKKKSIQHENIRRAGIPYIIAILLPAVGFSTEEIENAWLEIDDATVTGLLVFKARSDIHSRRRSLEGWYLPNPKTNSPIDPQDIRRFLHVR
jgi:hypothetical protein